jgi:bifunctional ADP-heptose synthase (sugar kinase/adenylyltransferase)
VVVSDYGKGALNPTLRKILRESGRRLWVDTKGDPLEYGEDVNVTFFPNLSEYQTHAPRYALVAQM